MNSENTYKIPLTEKSRINFELKYSFSFIKVLKIQADSLMNLPDNEWIEQLYKVNLVFIYTDKQGLTRTIPYNLGAQITPYHMRPIIEFNLIVPEENKSNMTSFGNFVNELSIILQNSPGNELPQISLSLFIETSPGVVRKDL
ncbi:MAG: hypothetical protein ACK40M_10650 [Flavobacteriales bacterium]